ncbi:M48 family metallopeptidase [Photobacterium damselae]|uniref:M48 metallopeptidase family protein n=1 Tax=Photobacterium damselae TaxID=38293 RepID=UPI00083B6E6B|nr:M48 family metallopeptidase [Photobacterium damselae]KAB1515865.1 M48 family metallopeptidase [Photobacterium damselae subsp. damselae]NVH52961.1 M48 family metallopeptidase [Photobacterium damselae subsp. damselae]NVO80728.1 M48 family metallopeptidase [Photobacterium damselae subsp. damselae]ODA20524.1 metal-dependent hydrolase [Photobacterium damselae subsp. damselae]TLS70488.1 M48 family metallopeptidase [Photobacterium damselae subsp. damselae]
MKQLKYLQGYPPHLLEQVQRLIEQDKLKDLLLKRYPKPHTITTEKALYDFTIDLKNQYIKKSAPLNKVNFDNKINVVNHALGLHTFVSRVHGNKLKAKNEIKIAALFKNAPLPLLRMIVVHELAHIKEKEHNKAFYQLCCHMEPNYHQLEFDTRLYLTQVEFFGPVYE